MTTSLPVAALGAALLLAGLAGPAAAQPQPQDWRAQVDALLDRWSDDPGADRLDRARALLERRVKDAPDDAAAQVELARALLALGRASEALAAADRGLERMRQEEHSARERVTALNVERREKGLDPLEVGPELAERRAQAQAIAFLAAHEHALARARGLDGDKAAAVLREQQAERARRHEALRAAAGGEQEAGARLAQEQARRRHLRSLDRLGREPRPLGQTDAAGQPIELGAYRGKVLLVVFWSLALDPEDVLVEIDGVLRELGPKGFEVLGVCLDEPGGAASEWLHQQKIAWRQVFTGEGLLSRDARAWQIETVPAAVLVDHTGRVRWLDPWEGDLRLAVTELLRRKDEALEAARRRGW
ncbi:MAG: redoxin domain-containing protein [Planctomycetes bacterium]|nr:redoxin domain-containing protein [Planctomycetota bacterium]